MELSLEYGNFPKKKLNQWEEKTIQVKFFTFHYRQKKTIPFATFTILYFEIIDIFTFHLSGF